MPEKTTTAAVRRFPQPKPARRLPRGFRNNNPGNIRHSADNWQGKAAEQLDESFVTFKSMTWGLRALARVLIVYAEKHGLNTVAGIVSRWAPPNENETTAYVQAVAAALRVHPDEELDLHRFDVMAPLVTAIVRHECGDPRDFGRTAWFTPDELEQGLKLAGIVRRAPTTVREAARRDPEGTAVVATGAGAVGTTGGVVYLVSELREANKALRDHGRETGEAAFVVAPVVLTLIAAAAAVFFWRKRKKAQPKGD